MLDALNIRNLNMNGYGRLIRVGRIAFACLGGFASTGFVTISKDNPKGVGLCK